MSLNHFFTKAKTLILKHKVISLIILLVIIGGGYFWYHTAAASSGKVTYVTMPAAMGTIVTSVSGSGQVSSSDQIDLKSKVSENVTYVGVQEGQQVSQGTLLMEFDTTDAEKSVRDAQLSLQNAQLSLEKLAGSSDLTVPQNQQDAQDTLNKDYNTTYNNIANAFIDLPNVMTGLNNILYGYTLSNNQENIDYYTDDTYTYDQGVNTYKDSANTSYQTALAAYTQSFNDYKAASADSSQTQLDALTQETIDTSNDITQAIKDANNLIQFYENTFTKYNLKINPTADTQLSTLNTYLGKVNTDGSALINTQNSIVSDKENVAGAGLNLQSQQLSLQQVQNSLDDAKDNLSNCYIYAPFNGIVAAIDYQKGDAASSGSTAVTMITNQSITQIPLNEVDISKIKIGQKATLTFDAIPDLTIVGQVQEIDTLGTVTQGVVTYNVKLVFATQDTQVKTGMSVDANIITDTAQNVLVVPNSAIKKSGSTSYVQVLVNGVPERKTVQTGLASDTQTQILSGISAGDNVITQTITTAKTTAATSANSTVRIPGLTGGAAGFAGGGGGGGFGAGGAR